MAHYLPTAGDLAGLAAVWLAALVLMLLGRVVTGGRALPEIALPAGWGALCLVLTVWGAATPLTMRVPAVLLAATGLLGLAVPRLRPAAADWKALGRIAVLALPILVVMAHARPSQVDTFLNLLPNAVYLFDHGGFPADGRPESFSFLPAAPYNLQFVGFLAALPLPEFPANSLAFFNVVLQLVMGLLLARLLRHPDAPWEAAPSWSACTGGMLLVTGLNPGFVPRIDFAAYSEAGVAVTLGVAGWLAARAWQALAERRPAGAELWQLALVLAALSNIKQESVAFVAAVMVTLCGLAALDPSVGRSVGPAAAARRLAPAVLPAMVLYLAWRWYVMHAFSGEAELTLLPFDQWHLGTLPALFARIAQVMKEKVVFFGAVGLALALLIQLWRRQGATLVTRVLAVFAGVFVLYNAFLVFMYVAHFDVAETTNAHSYFRYSTHLSLLLMVALTSAGRELVLARRGVRAASSGSPRLVRFVPALAILVMLLAPIAFAKRLRFDEDPPQPLVWQLGRLAASHVADGDRLALVLPGDNGSVWVMLKAVLRFTPPRRTHLDLAEVRSLEPGGLEQTLATLARRGYDQALVSCTPPGVAGLPPRSAAFLRREGAAWRPIEVWRYPPVDPQHRWQPMLASAPLCREPVPAPVPASIPASVPPAGPASAATPASGPGQVPADVPGD